MTELIIEGANNRSFRTHNNDPLMTFPLPPPVVTNDINKRQL